MITPEEKAEEITNKYDMIIYSSEYPYTQVINCSIKEVESVLNVLDGIYNETEDNSEIETILLNEIRFYNKVLNIIKSKIKK